jgi:hypothetical protein
LPLSPSLTLKVDVCSLAVSVQLTNGCTIRSTLRIPIVAGHVTITLTKAACWNEALNHFMLRAQYSEDEKNKVPNVNDYNMTHFLHSVQF